MAFGNSRDVGNPDLSGRASGRYLGAKGFEYHQAYGEIWEIQAEGSRRILEKSLKPDDAVLDFGCADGSLLASLRNTEKVGVEVNPHSRRIAQSRGLRVHRTLADQESNSIDVAISSHVLEHTLRPLDELIELARVLKTTGTLVLILPLDDWRTQRKWKLPDPNHHLFTWTPQLLVNLLDEAGFYPSEVEILSYALPGRFTKDLYERLPRSMFDLTSRLAAVTRRRRQLLAIARLQHPN